MCRSSRLAAVEGGRVGLAAVPGEVGGDSEEIERITTIGSFDIKFELMPVSRRHTATFSAHAIHSHSS